MSALLKMQYQQHFPQQQSQPLLLELVQRQQRQQQKSVQPNQQSYLAAVSGNNYASQRATKRRLKRKQKQNRRHMQPAAMQAYRQLAGAASNNNYGQHVSDGSYTSYGSAPSGGEYPPNNVGYSSHYSGGQGTGYGEAPQHPPQHPQQYQSHPPVYGPPPQPVYHAPAYKPVKTMPNKNKKSDTTLSALTLLSFFFFVNLLQSCLKDHMATMNPTVMVMTVNGERNRFNKLAEINSREQNAAAAAAASSSSLAAIPQNAVVLDASDLIAAAASSHHVVPSIMLDQTPYSKNMNIKINHNNNDIDSNKLVSIGTEEYNYNNNNNYKNNNNNKNNKNDNINNAHNIKNNGGNQQQLGHQHASSFSNQSPRPEFYDSVHSYSNRNHSSSSLVYPDISNPPGNVFSSTYIRSKSLDKSHNYSSHEKMPVHHRTHGEWDRDHSRDIDRYIRPSYLDNSYNSYFLRGGTASPTAYWSLAAKTSSATDLLQHHDDDDIDRRYIGRSNTSRVSDFYAHYAK